MLSTLISGVLFALLILQTPTMVSALPTRTTTTAITSARLETRHASDSNRNNDNSHDNDNVNDNNLVPPDNTTTSKFISPLHQSFTSSAGAFTVHAVLPQFDKRDNSGGQKHDSSNMPKEILGIVIAALTLLVGIIPLFRYPRFRRWVSSISPTLKKASGIKLLNPVPPTSENPSDIPVPIPHSVYIYNEYSNTHLARTCSGTLCRQDGIGGEDSRIQPVEESLALKRPRRVLTCPLP